MEYVYKYRPIDKYTIELLVNNELYFSEPKEFNDPFDSLDNCIVEGTRENIEKWFEQNQIKQDLRDILLKSAKDNGDLKKIYYSRRNNIDNRETLVCCFSEINDNILMWSHYADSHKGICFGFKVDCLKQGLNPKNGTWEPIYELYFEEVMSHGETFRLLTKMEYSLDDKMPEEVNLIGEVIKDGEDFEKKLKVWEREIVFGYTKHKDWKYEKEIRVKLPWNTEKLKRKYKFKKEKLSQVIFGMNTSADDIKTVRKIVEEVYISKGFTVDLFKAEHIQEKYAVEIKPLNSKM